ncbi:MAG: protein-methionine-sulfoxide reductase catalytic subunit MsrP [Pseudomonadales bacterium]
MSFVIKTPADVKPSEITPESVYQTRRRFMRVVATAGLASSVPAAALRDGWMDSKGFKTAPPSEDTVTPRGYATSFNNFYEFGADKNDPAELGDRLTTEPWSVEVRGLVEKPGTYDIEDLLTGIDLEERVYRLRCVESWSMVIPWIGFPLKTLLERFNPLGSAKYVVFTTLYRPEEMPGQRSYFSSIKYPYVEGLRLDEAYHPLAIIAVGMYGQVLPNQNGAPLRLVVPWKYGFKSIKSIVRIELTETRPRTTWNLAASNEYGFYANVNPTVNHPRWSQGSERRLPNSLFNGNRKIETRMYNGYDEVAELYAGMNLRLNY